MAPYDNEAQTVALIAAASKLEESLDKDKVIVGFDPDSMKILLYWYGRSCPQYPKLIDGFAVWATKINRPVIAHESAAAFGDGESFELRRNKVRE